MRHDPTHGPARALIGLAFWAAWAILPPAAAAYSQRPLNLGATTIFDGGGSPPGLLWMNYVQLVSAKKAADKDGRSIAGNGQFTALADLNQFFYLSPLKVGGANLAFNLIIPVSAPAVKGTLGPVPLSANTAGLGDPTFGLALQWNDTKLFGAPFFHRAEVDVFAPWGKYDKDLMINPGQNFTTLEGYYAFTMFLPCDLETSWRLHYTWNSQNPDTKRKAGPLFHANYDLSYKVLPKLRVGAAGYILQQLADDTLDGVTQPDSRERAFAAGPVIGYMGQGLMAMLSYQMEFGVRNRFQGSQSTLQLIHKF